MKKINCQLNVEQIQFLYYLLEKEAKSTERFLHQSINDKKSSLTSYEELLDKKRVIQTLTDEIKKFYGGLNVK